MGGKLNEDERQNFIESRRKENNLEFKIIGVGLALAALVYFISPDAQEDPAGHDEGVTLCLWIIVATCMTMYANRFFLNRCPACLQYVGHEDHSGLTNYSTVRFCPKCGVDWLGSPKDEPNG